MFSPVIFPHSLADFFFFNNVYYQLNVLSSHHAQEFYVTSETFRNMAYREGKMNYKHERYFALYT